MRIACVHDGRAGHRSQAEGLCRWLGGGTTHEAARPAGWAERAGRLGLWLGVPPEGAAQPPVDGAQAVVSIGTRAAVTGLAAARRLGVPALALMRPWGVPAGAYRGMLLPAHDVAGEAPGVARLLVAPAPLSWREGARREEVAVLLGGPRHGRPWAWHKARDAVAGLSRSAAGARVTLRVAVSRRTPAGLIEALEGAGHRAIGPGEPPAIPDLLASVRGVVATDDSFSMVGEAVQAGFCPLVWRLGGAGRLGKGLAELAQRNWIRWEDPCSMPDLLADGPADTYQAVEAHAAAVAARVSEWVSGPS